MTTAPKHNTLKKHSTIKAKGELAARLLLVNKELEGLILKIGQEYGDFRDAYNLSLKLKALWMCDTFANSLRDAVDEADKELPDSVVSNVKSYLDVNKHAPLV